MPKLPAVKPRKLIKALKKFGFTEHRQKGSHLILVHKDKNSQITVPIHNKPLKKGTLAAILRQGEITLDDLRK